MSGFLLDTNIPSELIRRTPSPLVQGWMRAQQKESLFLSTVTIGELCKGFAILAPSKRRGYLEGWYRAEMLPWFDGRILPLTKEIAERWGAIDAGRRLKGFPVNVADGMIAATALEHRLTVATRNVRDFADLGVAIFNPWD